MSTKGKVTIMLVVLALAIGAIFRWKDKVMPPAPVPQINMAQVQEQMKIQAAEAAKKAVADAEAKKLAGVMDKLLAGTNAASLVDSSTIPPVAAASDYEHTMKNGHIVIKQAINVWPGWAPFIMANHGMKPNDDSVFFKKYGFYVDLIQVDDPVHARDLFASGGIHSTWGTLDMFAIFAPELARDSRTSPVIVQQFDWSAGGDGIVARNGIKTINDLRAVNGRRKKVVLAQYSPSHYFIMTMLINANINPNEIDFRWSADAPSAAKIFVQDKSYDAFVGWSPDIYTVSEGCPDSLLICSSKTGNQMIMDTYAFRNDFFRDNPTIVANYVRGVFEGIDMVRANPTNAAIQLSTAFGIPTNDCLAMVGKDGGIVTGDAHLTNYRENVKVFSEAGNPANFEAIWNRAGLIYQQLGAITTPLPASKVKASQVLNSMSLEYKDVRDLSQPVFRPGIASKTLEATDREIMVKSISIKFAPNSSTLDTNYDPNISASLEEVGKLSGAMGYTVVGIEGNSDASKKGIVNADDVRRLSYDRAEAVRRALLEKYPTLDPNRFAIKGNGFDNPLPTMTDPTNVEHNRANRRTDVRIMAPEESETK